MFGGANHLPLCPKKPIFPLRVGKKEAGVFFLTGPFLIITMALATTRPPVWSLKAILLLWLMLFGYWIFGGCLRNVKLSVTRVTCSGMIPGNGRSWALSKVHHTSFYS